MPTTHANPRMFRPHFGYTPNREATRNFCDSLRIRTFGDTLAYRDGPVEQKDVELWLPLMQLKPSWQRGAQGIGDCVSWGWELGQTTLMTIQHMLGLGQWITEAATEPNYGGSRVEARGGKLGGYSDGSYGAAAARWARDWGTVLRLDYSQQTGIEEHNLTSYSSKKAKAWGNFGCGGADDAGREDGKLDKIAKLMPCKEVTQVTTTEQAERAIHNGYPIPVCSGVGFGDMQRNSEGIVRASGSWAHCMMIGGVRYIRSSNTRLWRLFQSWGKSCSGPDPGIEHEAISWCSWWITDDDFARILRADDSFAIGLQDGMPPQKLDLSRLQTHATPAYVLGGERAVAL